MEIGGNRINFLDLTISKNEFEAATLLDFEHLPTFEDPLYVGNFTKKYKLADVSFSNVRVSGMRNFRSADVHTDPKDRTVSFSSALYYILSINPDRDFLNYCTYARRWIFA
jgi:hypothetical protein